MGLALGFLGIKNKFLQKVDITSELDLMSGWPVLLSLWVTAFCMVFAPALGFPCLHLLPPPRVIMRIK